MDILISSDVVEEDEDDDDEEEEVGERVEEAGNKAYCGEHFQLVFKMCSGSLWMTVRYSNLRMMSTSR